MIQNASTYNMDRFTHLGDPPADGNTPGYDDLTVLDGAYRQSPGSETFWGPKYSASICDPPEIEG